MPAKPVPKPVQSATVVWLNNEDRAVVDNKTIEAWRKAPRLTSFATFFEKTASGLGGAPDLATPAPQMDLLSFDLDCMIFWDTHRRLWGHFDSHYFASIPYRLEEESRLGAAILLFGQKAWARSGKPATIYTLGAGAGTLARSLARLGDGRLQTLNCSPTDGNRVCFFARRGSDDAHFYHGPFFDLDDERYATDVDLRPFQDGYDVLFEDTTFQMYGRDRDNQTGFISPRLRPNGVLVQVQKLTHQNIEAYLERERQKDGMFKSRFFSADQIVDKKRGVLDTMVDFQVDLVTSRSALRSHFRYAVVTWNSGNFYTFVSSNSLGSLRDFVMSMVKPAIPSEFCHEPVPQILVNDEHEPMEADWHWRSPQSIVTEI